MTAPAAASPPALELAAHAAAPLDADRGIVRLDPADLAKIGARAGDVVELRGARSAFARALPAHQRHRGLGLVLMDAALRENAKIAVGDSVQVSRAEARPAAEIRVALHEAPRLRAESLSELIRPRVLDVPLSTGDKLRIRLAGGRALLAEVQAVTPAGPVLPAAETRIVVEGAARGATGEGRAFGYEDLGGLQEQVARVREMVELPLRRPELFARLGVDPPKGVLFTGPPGTGKTLLARAVAAESHAAFFRINGPEIVSKHYGDSEAALRKLFQEAEAKAPSIIFIDEIDAIAPKRDGMAGDRQLERRVVAQLLTLLDGLSERGQVVVMAATNLPDSLDPALRRPGRFDREIAFRPPSKAARREILDIHTRAMPLHGGVDLDAVAAATHGFVGADLAALARETALAALRRTGSLETVAPSEIVVQAADFDEALKAVSPSAIREVFTETPEIAFADIGGLEEAKQALTEAVVWPLAHPEAFAKLGVEPAKGVLLAGPPGCGKTMLAKALAHESGVNFIAVRGAQLLSKYLGESERAVRDVFLKARNAAPCILFFDEIDAVAPRRVGAEPTAERVVAQLLTEIDGVDELKGVFLLAATNRPDAVDPALTRPGRFDLVLELGPPDPAARRAILALAFANAPMGPGVDLDALAGETAGWVGAEIAALAQAAKRLALRRAVGGGAETHVEPGDVAEALATLRKSEAARRKGSHAS